MEERQQQMEDMKHTILSRILDQSARARCNIFYVIDITTKLIIVSDIFMFVNSEYALPWQAREREDGRRDAS